MSRVLDRSYEDEVKTSVLEAVDALALSEAESISGILAAAFELADRIGDEALDEGATLWADGFRGEDNDRDTA